VVPGRDADLRAPGDALNDRRVFVIFNPASGRGRGAKRIALYRRLLEERIPRVEYLTTSRPGEEGELAERAIEAGADVVAAAGGDGTWSNVADRVVASGRDDVAFAMLPNGTGNDFGRNLGLHPSDASEAVQVLARGATRRVDVGRVETLSASAHTPDRPEFRHFLNLIGFGFDVAVIDAAARATFLKGELLYKVTALQQLFRFPGIRFALHGDSGTERNDRHLMLTVSNGRYFGGGFPIAPGARVDDGRLHACRILDAPPVTRLKLFNLAEKGRHVESERVEVLDESGFRLTFDAPPRFEMDGDVRRAAEAEVRVRVLPAALTVVAPADT
jgi:diacylglycerol kinase (ATP)